MTELSSSITTQGRSRFPCVQTGTSQRLLYLPPASLRAPAHNVQPLNNPLGTRCPVDKDTFVHVLLGKQGSAMPCAMLLAGPRLPPACCQQECKRHSTGKEHIVLLYKNDQIRHLRPRSAKESHKTPQGHQLQGPSS